MKKTILLLISVILILGLSIDVADAKKGPKPPMCGELGSCVDALECENNNPDLQLHACEEWSCNVDGCCEIDTSFCPDCYGAIDATVQGGGPGSKKVDKQVAVYVFVVNSAGIVDSSVDSITVCDPTTFWGDAFRGVGPNPSTVTYNGEPVAVSDTGVFVLEVGAGGILYLDNLDNGGRDIDEIIINTTSVSP